MNLNKTISIMKKTIKIMKIEISNEIYKGFVLLDEEMIWIQGGGDGQYIMTTVPPIKI
jgi:hypothetical protein